MRGISVAMGRPSPRAISTVIGKSWVQRPSVKVVARATALSFGMCLSSTSITKTPTCTRALADMSARISISSLMSSGFLRERSLMMDAAGMSPIWGSTGPSTAFGSITISSAASAMSEPPDIA